MGNNKFGIKNIIKKMFGQKEVLKEVVNGSTIYEKKSGVSSYLTFSSPNSFTLNVVDNLKYWDGTLEYSTDTTNWTEWLGTSAISSGVSGNNNVLYMRGTGNTYITGSDASTETDLEKAFWVLNGSNISCEGNIENLLDYATVSLGNHPVMASYCYYYMFYNCTSLTVAPELSATTLTDYCYRSMFSGCSSLTTTPSLLATTLADRCYQYMFYNCTSLTTVSSLSATTLATYCYYGMFSGCSSLTTAPSLLATTLANYCYAFMFQYCSSLTTAPTLPATTLADYCYYYMFRYCSSLTTLPALPATILASNCYSNMFYSCTSLITTPALSVTTLADYCYYSMFRDCSSLTTLPALPATTLVNNCYANMFNGCTKIKLSSRKTGSYQTNYRIPTTGTGTTASSALYNMFSNTGGTFTSSPTINTTYYTSNTVIPAGGN